MCSSRRRGVTPAAGPPPPQGTRGFGRAIWQGRALGGRDQRGKSTSPGTFGFTHGFCASLASTSSTVRSREHDNKQALGASPPGEWRMRCQRAIFRPGAHGVLKFSYALRTDGIWRTALFAVALEGLSPLEQRRGVAEIFEGMERTILATSFSPTSPHRLDA